MHELSESGGTATSVRYCHICVCALSILGIGRPKKGKKIAFRFYEASVSANFFNFFVAYLECGLPSAEKSTSTSECSGLHVGLFPVQ